MTVPAMNRSSKSQYLVVKKSHRAPSSEGKKSENKGYTARLLSALKEWGGVLTLLIAILYTFPVGVFDRITLSNEKQIASSRQVLADGSSMMIERILNTSKITEPRSLDMMNNMYNVKFFNLVSSNKQLLSETKTHLKSNELATMAGLLTFSGLIPEALSYYDAAIEKAKKEKVPYANTLRDKAIALTYPGATKSINLVREAYVEALEFYSKINDPAAGRYYAIFLSELAFAEANMGDWACAEKLRGIAENLFNLIKFRDPSITTYQDMFVQNFSNAIKKSDQSQKGCEYKIAHFEFN